MSNAEAPNKAGFDECIETCSQARPCFAGLTARMGDNKPPKIALLKEFERVAKCFGENNLAG